MKIRLLLNALVLVGLIGTGTITLAAAEQPSDSDRPGTHGTAVEQSGSTPTSAGGTSPRADDSKASPEKSSLWAKWSSRRRRAPFKMGLGLLGAAVFALVLTPSRTILRRIPTSTALAVATAVMMCFVGVTIQVLSGGVTPWASILATGYCMLGLVWLGRTLSTRADPLWSSRLRADALVFVIVSGALAWTSYGSIHGGRFVQMHEFFHYYVGSKYFNENRYLRIYDCTVIAEDEDGVSVSGRKVRNLEMNRGGLADEVLVRRADCLDTYSAERWRAFRQDVRLFKSRMSLGGWVAMLQDKGYNATPLWTSIGSRLSNWSWNKYVPTPEREYSPSALMNLPPQEQQRRRDAFLEDRERFGTRLVILSVLDPLLYAGAFGLVYWAFGLEACALMALLLGIGAPWDFRYTGGAFARIPWFFCATASVCLVKKGYQAWGAGGLAASAMLRLFPGALFGGVALIAAVRAVLHRTLTRAHKRMVLGALVGLAVLVPLSISTGGPSIYSEFLANTARHASTPLTNHAGLRALFSLNPDGLLRQTFNPTAPDSNAEWREGRTETFQGRKIYYGICVALLTVLVWAAARKMEDWERLIAGTLLIVMLVDLTSYYLLFMLLWAPFASRRIRDTLIVIGMAILTQVPMLVSRMTDEQNLAVSAIVIGFLCTMLLLVASDPDRRADPDLQTIPAEDPVFPRD